jgi:DNA (cytosine-5)-methyltransferase 1
MLKLLDLYCCAGGAAAGYHAAGFDVTGVDIVKRKNYPYRCFQHDAIDFVLNWGHLFDFVHASPPCQEYSNSTAVHKSLGKTYVDLIAPTRDALDKVGVPYVIENVLQAPIRPDIILRGDIFGLKVIRKRKFELGGWWALQPGLPVNSISIKGGTGVCIYGNASWKNTGSMNKPREHYIPEWRKNTIRETWAYAMGIDHYMTDREIAESIPPAYSQYIGEIFLQYIANKNF